MSRNIPWPRIIAEGVAIVTSILLAFGIQAWWEGRQEGDQATAIVRALQAEFQEARLELERVKALNEEVLLTVSDVVARVESSSGPVAVPLAQAVRIVQTPTLDPPMGELQSLLQSGDLRLIHDPDLRRALAAWPTLVADLDEKSQLHVSFVYGELLPALRNVTSLGPIVDHRYGLVPPDTTVLVPASRDVAALLQHLRLFPLRTLNSGRIMSRMFDTLDEIDRGLVRSGGG